MSIIGISGKARHGKNTVATYLQDKYGFILKFSDALYEECRNCRMYRYESKANSRLKDMIGIYSNKHRYDFNIKQVPIIDKLLGNNNHYNGMTEKEDPILLRWWWNFRKKQDLDYWVKKLKEKIHQLGCIKYLASIVIPDVRFLNEAEMIKGFGGEVWDVRRYDKFKEFLNTKHKKYKYKKVPYISPDRPADHPSEVDLDDYKFDRVLEAESGDVKSLFLMVDNIMENNLK